MHWLLAAAMLMARAESAQAPARNMEGGCEAYSWDMNRELAAWERPALSLTALADGSAASDSMPLGRKFDVTLHPLAPAAPSRRSPCS